MTGQNEPWRVEKTISYSDIITTVAMLATVIGLFVSMDRRIEENAASLEALASLQKQNDRRQDDLRERLSSTLERVDKKLDRVIELQSMRSNQND